MKEHLKSATELVAFLHSAIPRTTDARCGIPEVPGQQNIAGRTAPPTNDKQYDKVPHRYSKRRLKIVSFSTRWSDSLSKTSL